jgi:lipopolysaccharide transport system permease protein
MQKELIIQPTRGLSSLKLGEIWEYKELFYFLVWRDVKVRYKQTFLGASWAIFRPVTSMILLTFVFNRLAGFTSGDIPYPLFTYCGILAWNFFSEGVTSASQSLVSNAHLISKIYFPRLIIPSSAILRGLIDFGIAFVVYILLMIYYKLSPSSSVIFLPLFILQEIIVALGIGLWFSAIGVKYRDIGHALPFVIQFLFWITPVGYSSAEIPEKWQLLYWLNPMTGVIEGFRYCLLGLNNLSTNLLLFSVGIAIFIFITGFINFKRMEKEFADVI